MSISLARRFCLGITVVMLAVIFSSAAFSADWPMFRHDSNHTGVAADGVAPPLKMAWSTKLGEVILSSPAIVGGIVYVGSRNGTVQPTSTEPDKVALNRKEIGALNALDAKTGKLLWKYVGTEAEPVGWVDSSPAVVNGVIYFTSRDGHLYAIDTKGKLKWKYKSGGTEMSSPVVHNGLVFYGGGYPNKDVFAVDAQTGKLKWKFPTGQMIYSSPAASSGVVYIGSDDGRFYALDAATGKEKWRFETRGGVFFYSPLVKDGVVYCAPGDYDPSINAVDAATGKLKWKLDSDSQNNYVCSPTLKNGVLYLCTGQPENRLYAIDAATGKLKWRVLLGVTTPQMFVSSPAFSGSTIYIGAGPEKPGEDRGGKLMAIDPASGKTKWEFKTEDPVISSPAVSGSTVVVGTLGGTLYGFTGTPESSGAKAPSTARPKPKPAPKSRRR